MSVYLGTEPSDYFQGLRGSSRAVVGCPQGLNLRGQEWISEQWSQGPGRQLPKSCSRQCGGVERQSVTERAGLLHVSSVVTDNSSLTVAMPTGPGGG